MAVRDSLARLFGVKASIVGLTADELPDRALEKGYDDATLLSTYGDDAWPYILANKVGEQASQAPLQVGRVTRARDGSEEFAPVGPDHPVQQLLDRPNPMYEGGEFTHLLMIYMALTGHAPIEVVKPGPGGVIGAPGRRGQRLRDGFELWLHNPGPWRIVANPDGTVRGYLWVNTSAEDIRWLPEQMTYLRWPNPANRWYGQGHIQAVRQQVMAEEYAAIRDRKFEKNLGVPPGILSTEMPLGDPQAAELQRRWERAVGGYANAGKIAVLGSKTTYQSVALNARDSEWLKQRHDRVEIMAAAFGVPLPLIRMQDAKFANAQEARAEFWEGTLQPRLNRIARMLTYRLLPLVTTEPLEVRFDYHQIEALGENDLTAAQTAGAWANTGAVRVDEVRHRLGLPPLGDDNGQRLLVPSSLQLKTTDEIAANAEMGLAGAAAAIEATRNPQPPQDDDEPPRRRSVVPAAAKADEPDRETLLAPIRKSYEADLGAYFLAQRAALNDIFGGKALSTEEAAQIIERAIAILTAKRWRERLLRISTNPIQAALTLGAESAARTLGISISFALPASEAALARVTSHLNVLSVGIQNTTVEDVRRILTQSLREGVTNAEIRTRLNTLFNNDYQAWRLDRISRTETTAAYNVGSIGQYRDAGVQMVKVADGDLDDPCATANGAEWTLDEAEGNPLAHPNCTRTWIPITAPLLEGLRSRVPADTKADQRHAELLAALTRQEAPSVTVTIADGAVSVPITVSAPDIHLPEQAAPVVHVSPQVKADAPIVNVTMPADLSVRITEMPEPAPVVRTVERDATGNIVRVVEQ